MKIVYRAADTIEAHIVSGLIRSYGIETYVGGHYLQGGVGEIATMGFANVQVNDDDWDQAQKIVAEYKGHL